MLHGKKETRWVRKGFKPPFPLGEYLFYSTKKKCDNSTLFQWCGPELILSITETLSGDITRFMNGTAIGTGTLVNVRLMTKEDESTAFVKFIGEKVMLNKEGIEVTYMQWVLEFEIVTAIEPFPFAQGKQGIGKFMMNSEPNAKASVATDDDSNENAGK